MQTLATEQLQLTQGRNNYNQIDTHKKNINFISCAEKSPFQWVGSKLKPLKSWRNGCSTTRK